MFWFDCLVYLCLIVFVLLFVVFRFVLLDWFVDIFGYYVEMLTLMVFTLVYLFCVLYYCGLFFFGLIVWFVFLFALILVFACFYFDLFIVGFVLTDTVIRLIDLVTFDCDLVWDGAYYVLFGFNYVFVVWLWVCFSFGVYWLVCGLSWVISVSVLHCFGCFDWLMIFSCCLGLFFLRDSLAWILHFAGFWLLFLFGFVLYVYCLFCFVLRGFINWHLDLLFYDRFSCVLVVDFVFVAWFLRLVGLGWCFIVNSLNVVVCPFIWWFLLR